MSPTEVPRFGLKFLSRKERTVRRVTKCETRNIQKRESTIFTGFKINYLLNIQGLEPPKPVYEKPKPQPKLKPAKLPKPRPATLVKADRPLGPPAGRRGRHPPRTSADLIPKKKLVNEGPRVLQKTDLEKLARLNCSREFSLFHQFIKNDLAASFENQLAFLQTKLQHLKNEFVNKQGEHLNFEQIRDYFNQAVEQQAKRQIKSDEYLTLSEKYRQDIKIVIILKKTLS